jgi:hypothetical protein
MLGFIKVMMFSHYIFPIFLFLIGNAMYTVGKRIVEALRQAHLERYIEEVI